MMLDGYWDFILRGTLKVRRGTPYKICLNTSQVSLKILPLCILYARVPSVGMHGPNYSSVWNKSNRFKVGFRMEKSKIEGINGTPIPILYPMHASWSNN